MPNNPELIVHNIKPEELLGMFASVGRSADFGTCHEDVVHYVDLMKDVKTKQRRPMPLLLEKKSETSDAEQIVAEYKARALQLHPDKNDGDKEAEAKFQKLKEAKEILCDPEKRANYDKWRNSGISISYKQWLGMKEHVHQSMHWTTLKTKDRMLPETGAEGEGSSRAASAASRRASEGGANIHWGGRGNVQWDNKAPNEVVNKFRNYEI